MHGLAWCQLRDILELWREHLPKICSASSLPMAFQSSLSQRKIWVQNCRHLFLARKYHFRSPIQLEIFGNSYHTIKPMTIQYINDVNAHEPCLLILNMLLKTQTIPERLLEVSSMPKIHAHHASCRLHTGAKILLLGEEGLQWDKRTTITVVMPKHEHEIVLQDGRMDAHASCHLAGNNLFWNSWNQNSFGMTIKLTNY